MPNIREKWKDVAGFMTVKCPVNTNTTLHLSFISFCVLVPPPTLQSSQFLYKKLMHDAMCHNLFYLETAFTIYPHEMVKREVPLGNLGSFHRSKLGKSYDCKTPKLAETTKWLRIYPLGGSSCFIQPYRIFMLL